MKRIRYVKLSSGELVSKQLYSNLRVVISTENEVSLRDSRTEAVVFKSFGPLTTSKAKKKAKEALSNFGVVFAEEKRTRGTITE